MPQSRVSLYRSIVSLCASLAIVAALTACGGSTGSFSSVPSVSTGDRGRTEDWDTGHRVWGGRHRRPGTGHDATPTPLASNSPSADPSASASPATTPTALPTATLPTATPSATPTVMPSATPTVRPTATPTVHPTATPKASAVVPYDPPAGTFPFFPAAVWQQRLPANPTVNANSAAWLAKLGTIGLTSISFAGNAAGVPKDYNYPIYPMNAGAAGSVPVKVHCTASYGTCGVEGKTVYVDLREIPEDGGHPGEDSHMALVDTAGGKEYDFWQVQWPPQNGVLTIGWGGSCTLTGNAYDGCAATASGTPLTEGIIRVSDLFNAMASPTGSLPYAIQVSTKCSNGYIAPMTGGDGHTPGCAPQGSRVYLALHDSDVDQLSAPAIAKAILRTIDEDHFGMIVADTDGGEDGFSMQVESDFTYTAFGQPGPLVNRFLPEAIAEGIPGTGIASNGVYDIAIPFGAADLANNLKFL